MRRADRLFEIIQIMRRRRLTTAAYLAERLEVSERTIYRDLRHLSCSGVPIDGEAGLGYVLRGFDLPPLMFSKEEIEALVLGARVVESWGDPGLVKAARSLLGKVEVVLPDELKGRLDTSPVFAVNFRPQPAVAADLSTLRHAIGERHPIRFAYRRADGTDSVREVRPLCVTFMAPVWMLSAWCELRQAFRNFRLDRMTELQTLDQTFEEEPGRSLADFLREVTAGSSRTTP